jgi:hypothetical protein
LRGRVTDKETAPPSIEPRPPRAMRAGAPRAHCRYHRACTFPSHPSCGDRPTVDAHAERVRERHHPSSCTAHGTIELLAAPEVEREPDLKCGVPRARRARIVLAVAKEPLRRSVLGELTHRGARGAHARRRPGCARPIRAGTVRATRAVRHR